MFMLDEPSRAWATCTTFVPEPRRSQNVVTLSATELESPLAMYSYWVSSVATRAPNPPACAAAATTEVEPVPCEVSQLVRPPDSKPSVNTTFVYCDRAACGVTAADCAEAAPVPMLLTAATVKVYAVPFVSPWTRNEVVVEPVRIGPCATP